MKNTITIRQEEARDYDKVRELVKLAFSNMEDSDHTEHLLVERLRKSEGYVPDLSLVAETADGQIAGHILLSKVKIVGDNGVFTVLAVAPLSVLPQFQRQGIGGTLIREAHKKAADLGYVAAVLLGHKDYYPKFGYKKASLFGIKFPFDVPDDYCMVIELRKGGLEGLHGTVQYPEAFQI